MQSPKLLKLWSSLHYVHCVFQVGLIAARRTGRIRGTKGAMKADKEGAH